MPGMMDTILDVGMNAASVHGLIRVTGNPRMAFDSWRRFIQGYAEVVGGVAPGGFASLVAEMVRAEGVANEAELDSEALERLVDQFLALSVAPRRTRRPRIRSSRSPRRRRRSISPGTARGRASIAASIASKACKGTAVTVQTMAFGNSGGDSGAGVAFSRDPATGENALYVDFLADAQGEDVVSGRRSPSDAAMFARRMPEVAQQLAGGRAHARDRLPRRAGHGVHGRARPALVPPDALGQAHAARRPEDRRRSGRRGPDRQKRGARAGSPTSISPPPASRISLKPPSPRRARSSPRPASPAGAPASRAPAPRRSPSGASRRSWSGATRRPRMWRASPPPTAF